MEYTEAVAGQSVGNLTYTLQEACNYGLGATNADGTPGFKPGPRFCVVTATRNRLPFLRRCVQSVQEQTWGAPYHYSYRHLIINDKSTYPTWRYLHRLSQEDPRVHAVDLAENMGQRQAIELGKIAMLQAQRAAMSEDTYRPGSLDLLADYYIVLDDDDMLTPDALYIISRNIQEFQLQHGRLPRLLFGHANIVDKNGKHLDDVPHILGYNNIPDTTDPPAFYEAMLECNHIPGKAVIHRDSFLSTLELPDWIVSYDWFLANAALVDAALASPDGAGYVDISRSPHAGPISVYRVHDKQRSIRDQADGIWEEERKFIERSPRFNPVLARLLQAEARQDRLPAQLARLQRTIANMVLRGDGTVNNL